MQIVSRYWQGYFVHFFTGFPRVATHLLTAEVVANSGKTAATVLLQTVLGLGMIHVRASDGFGIANKEALSRILNSMTSCIALAHPNVPDLARQTIMAIPAYNGNTGRLNNKKYEKANIPIFYVDNTPCKTATAVVRLVRINNRTVLGVCRALKERFFRQESNEPIQSTEEETQMLGGRNIVCRIERRRGR